MKTPKLSFTLDMFAKTGKAVFTVLVTTLILFLIGRDVLGEAVIALLLLVPVGYSTSQWGQGPGMSAAMVAALLFDFLFIPPFYTFAVGSLESWLVLIIFLTVAIVVIGRIQTGLSRAQASEREALFMYELSSALAGMRTQTAVAYTLARNLQQMFFGSQVKVVLQSVGPAPAIIVSEPQNGNNGFPDPRLDAARPDRVLPIWNAWGMVGEIQIWRGEVELPPAESRLLQSFASQAAQALERTRFAETDPTSKPTN